MRFRDVHMDGQALGPIVRDLTKGKIKPSMGVHLDPDLEAESIMRERGWQPLFGQMGAAEGHLRGRGIAPGDVFLFFGWFRDVEREKRRWRYRKGAQDQHVFFGWFQIEAIWPLVGDLKEIPDWAKQHPHFFGNRGKNNTLYVGRQGLSLPGDHARLPGCGVFKHIRPELVLTRAGENRCEWSLPSWFHPEGRASCLSYHDRRERWQEQGDRVHLKSVARGQEFVLDIEHYPEAVAWLISLIEQGHRHVAKDE